MPRYLDSGTPWWINDAVGSWLIVENSPFVLSYLGMYCMLFPLNRWAENFDHPGMASTSGLFLHSLSGSQGCWMRQVKISPSHFVVKVSFPSALHMMLLLSLYGSLELSSTWPQLLSLHLQCSDRLLFPKTEQTDNLKFGTLQRVNMVNTGNLICQYCGQSFQRQDHLTRHELSHREARYYCQVTTCGMAFHRRDVLKCHGCVY